MTKAEVLIVEDENIVALDIQNRLERLGYTIPALVSSGEEAIQKAIELRPQLILMDIKLKGTLDGIAAAEQIRAQFNVPIIYLTAYVDETTLQRAKITEPYAYLLKPIEDKELHTAIAMALYRHQMEQKLKESKQWLTTTLNSIGEAVIATDTEGCIKFMNPSAEALTGWLQTEALGKDSVEILQIINGKTGRPGEHPITKILQENKRFRLEKNSYLLARNGAKIPIEDSAAPIQDELGYIYGAVLVFQDVTERQQAEKRLHQYALDLERRNEELDAFAHTVAHNLKESLNPIIGYADILVSDYANIHPEEMKKYLEIIRDSGRKINGIINELLLLAEIRQTEIETRPLTMGHIVSQAQHRLDYLVKQYQAEIILPEPHLWPVARGYEPWVEEVWVNYLSNAIKYGGQPPQVEVGATRQPDGMIRFWIRDNGPGLKPEEQVRLFTPFTRLNYARVAGHGLGLSIVRRIVEKLGGQVGVESDSITETGSIFFFTLPDITAVHPQQK